MKLTKGKVFEFDGSNYRIYAIFGNLVNAKKLKDNGRAKMYSHCERFIITNEGINRA